MDKNRNILVSIINNAPFIQTPFFETLIPLLFEGSKDCKLAWMNVKAFPVDFARNWAIKGFLESEKYKTIDWFLFLDTDMTFPVDTIKMLLDGAEASGAKVLSGTYFKRNFEHEVVGWKYGPNHNMVEPCLDGTIQEVEIIGMGCALLHRDVLQKIGYPWFQYGRLHENMENLATEDIWFCERCKEIGQSIHIHTGIICGHLMTIENTPKRIIGLSMTDGPVSGTVVPDCRP